MPGLSGLSGCVRLRSTTARTCFRNASKALGPAYALSRSSVSRGELQSTTNLWPAGDVVSKAHAGEGDVKDTVVVRLRMRATVRGLGAILAGRNMLECEQRG